MRKKKKTNNKINPKLLYHILFQLYLWNSTKSFGSCSNMIWNNKKHSFFSKPIWTVIFHRSAHLMLSKLEKAWAEFNFFPPPPLFFLDKNQGISIPQFSHLHLLSHVGFWISLWSQKRRKSSLWRKEQKASRMGNCRASSSAGKNVLSSRWWEKGADYIPVGRTAKPNICQVL